MPATIDASCVEIKLACGNTVLVDADCVDLVSSRKWRYRGSIAGKRKTHEYVTANSYKQAYLHREIVGAVKGQVVDHINGNRLDNRRSNLRIVTHLENMRNRRKHLDGDDSRFKGVCQFKNGKWRAQIRDGEKQRYLGTFSSQIEAAYAYDLASLELHGEFGRRNFLPFC